MKPMRIRWMLSVVMAGSLGLPMVCPLGAQVVRGVVRDSTSQLAIAGAVISTLDSAGRVGVRVLSNERGLYRIPAASRVARLQVVRLGFRPVEVRVPAGGGDHELDILMKRIPYGLQPVHVTGGQRCPRRSDRSAALALFEQARDGLLATVVARSAKGARMKRLMIDRVHDGESERLKRHKIAIDTAANSIASFVAAHSAVDFVSEGFSADSGEGVTFYAPDADVLLDDGFANGYCFHLMNPVRARPNQVGLGFRSADRKRGRIDVDGALWIDTVARALVDIEYRYVGLPAEVTRLDPGGRVAFRAMPNGVVLIDRWMLRLVTSEVDSSVPAPRPAAPSSPTRGAAPPASPTIRLMVTESGGELASVAWPDGTSWRAELGRLALTVTNLQGEPMRAARVRLEDTDYEAVTDSAGHLEIEDLAPGPYSARRVDPRLEPINLTLPMALSFVAERGAVVTRSVRVGTTEDYVGNMCRQDTKSIVSKEPFANVAWVIGRVTDPSGQPLRNVLAGVPFAYRNDAREPVLSSNPFETFSRIGTDGLFAFCVLKRDAPVDITFKRGMQTIGTISYVPSDALNVLPVVLDVGSKRQ